MSKGAIFSFFLYAVLATLDTWYISTAYIENETSSVSAPVVGVEAAEEGGPCMSRWFLCLCAFLSGGICLSLGEATQAAEKTPSDRGRDLMFHRSLNPPIWSFTAY